MCGLKNDAVAAAATAVEDEKHVPKREYKSSAQISIR